MTTTKYIPKNEVEKLLEELGNFELTRGCLLLAKESYRLNDEGDLIKNGGSAKHPCAILGDAISIVAASSEREVTTVCERGRESLHFSPEYIPETFKILGHPIMLGRVRRLIIKKLKQEYVSVYYNHDWKDRIRVQLQHFSELWDECDTEKSLQEIVDSGWEGVFNDKVEAVEKFKHRGGKFTINKVDYRLKSPTNSLCIFLRDLNLSK